ncbi:MAG: RhuM family protein [Algoriphagus sp.]|uniref:RhuM family protein n=1 Tax=Algoriphagus sp. TaxID=1872435 RepID=UPI0032994CD3
MECIIISISFYLGYRVNSKQGTQFKIWATQRLKNFLAQDYAINEARLSQKQQEVQTLKD